MARLTIVQPRTSRLLAKGELTYDKAVELTKNGKAHIASIARGVIEPFKVAKEGGRISGCYYFDNYFHAYAFSIKQPKNEFIYLIKPCEEAS